MGVEYVQSNLTAGELAPVLHARVDINKYNNGVGTATNMVILPHGGMRRRPGLSKIEDSKIGENARLTPFVFNTAQKYLVVYRSGFIDIFRDGVKVAGDIVSPYVDGTVIQELDVIQSADTMIISHELHPTHRLQRQGDDATWLLEAITFTNPPQFDFGSGAENAWSATRGYPSVCTFHQNRLWLAGSTQLPTTIWGSKTSGFFDFGLGTAAADDALADTLDTDQYNKITNIFSGRELQVFTTGGEFINSATIITPVDSEWRKQTGYGSIRMRPLSIDGATLFVDSSARTVRQFLFDFNEGNNVSLNLSLLSSHLIKDVVAIDAIKGTRFDVGDYAYVVNTDGTCAVLNTMRNEQISGWTHWETAGLFKDVAVVDKDVYFLVFREGDYFIELLTENTYTDHNVVIPGVKPDTDNIIAGADNIVFNGDNIVFTNTNTGVPLTEIITDYDGAFANTEFKVVADFSIMPDAKYEGTSGDNKFTISRVAYRIEVGLNFITSVITLPASTETQKGVTLYRRKRIVKVDIDVLDSLGVYARNILAPDRMFTVVLDQTPELFTGFRELYLLGYDRLTTVEIHQLQPLPFILRGLGTEIAY